MVKDFGFDITMGVIESWENLKTIPNYAEATGIKLYQRLFEQCPKMKELFGFPIDMDVYSDTVVKSKAFRMQAKYIVDMLDRSIGMLGPDIELLTDILCDLGRRHIHYGVTADMYPLMGEALIAAMEEQLTEDEFTPEMKEAWEVMYGAMTYDMIHFDNPAV